MIHDAAKVGGASVIHDAAKVAEIYPAAAERTQAQMLRQLERFPLDLNREDYRGSLGRANQIRAATTAAGARDGEGVLERLRDRGTSWGR
jgi:hypothetical protein